MSATLRAGAAYFVAVFVAGFVLGTIRTLNIAPRFGEMAATVLELPVILGIAWLACRLVLQRIAVREDSASRLMMGAVALGLLLVAEALLSVTLGGLTLAEHVALYERPAVLLGLGGQVIFALFPVVKK